MLALSPIALRMLKAGFNAADDGLAGVQQLAGDATMLFYMSEEAQEGRDAYLEKRSPDFSPLPAPALSRALRRDGGRSAHVATAPRRAPAHAAGRGRRRSRSASAVARAERHVERRGGRCSALVVSLAIQIGDQLRQRLLRRHARHRRGPGRPGAPRRERARHARGGRAGGAWSPSASPASPGWSLALSTSPWLLARRGGLHRGGLVLHRRPPSLRLRRLRRGVRASSSSASSRSSGTVYVDAPVISPASAFSPRARSG